jgi:crotonobetaine/carnitine-CoA ligase
MIEESDVEVLFIDRGFLDRLKPIENSLKKLKTLIVYPDEEKTLPVRFEIRSWSHILKTPETMPEVDVTYRDTAIMLFTSGTTGVSKGVMMPHNQIIFTAEHETRALGLGPEGFRNTYSIAPMFHQFGVAMTMIVLLTESTMYMVEKFSRRRFWNDVRKWNITTSSLLGPMLQILLSTPEKADDANQPIRRMLVGLAPKDIQEIFEKRFNCRTADVFGLTEVEPVSIQDFQMRKPGSIGKGNED